jgi:hypothetical protein
VSLIAAVVLLAYSAYVSYRRRKLLYRCRTFLRLYGLDTGDPIIRQINEEIGQ